MKSSRFPKNAKTNVKSPPLANPTRHFAAKKASSADPSTSTPSTPKRATKKAPTTAPIASSLNLPSSTISDVSPTPKKSTKASENLDPTPLPHTSPSTPSESLPAVKKPRAKSTKTKPTSDPVTLAFDPIPPPQPTKSSKRPTNIAMKLPPPSKVLTPDLVVELTTANSSPKTPKSTKTIKNAKKSPLLDLSLNLATLTPDKSEPEQNLVIDLEPLNITPVLTTRAKKGSKAASNAVNKAQSSKPSRPITDIDDSEGKLDHSDFTTDESEGTSPKTRSSKARAKKTSPSVRLDSRLSNTFKMGQKQLNLGEIDLDGDEFGSFDDLVTRLGTLEPHVHTDPTHNDNTPIKNKSKSKSALSSTSHPTTTPSPHSSSSTTSSTTSSSISPSKVSQKPRKLLKVEAQKRLLLHSAQFIQSVMADLNQLPPKVLRDNIHTMIAIGRKQTKVEQMRMELKSLELSEAREAASSPSPSTSDQESPTQPESMEGSDGGSDEKSSDLQSPKTPPPKSQIMRQKVLHAYSSLARDWHALIRTCIADAVIFDLTKGKRKSKPSSNAEKPSKSSPSSPSTTHALQSASQSPHSTTSTTTSTPTNTPTLSPLHQSQSSLPTTPLTSPPPQTPMSELVVHDSPHLSRKLDPKNLNQFLVHTILQLRQSNASQTPETVLSSSGPPQTKPHPFDNFDPFDEVFKTNSDPPKFYPPPLLTQQNAQVLAVRHFHDQLILFKTSLPQPGLIYPMFFLHPEPKFKNRTEKQQYRAKVKQNLLRAIDDEIERVDKCYAVSQELHAVNEIKYQEDKRQQQIDEKKKRQKILQEQMLSNIAVANVSNLIRHGVSNVDIAGDTTGVSGVKGGQQNQNMIIPTPIAQSSLGSTKLSTPQPPPLPTHSTTSLIQAATHEAQVDAVKATLAEHKDAESALSHLPATKHLPTSTPSSHTDPSSQFSPSTTITDPPSLQVYQASFQNSPGAQRTLRNISSLVDNLQTKAQPPSRQGPESPQTPVDSVTSPTQLNISQSQPQSSLPPPQPRKKTPKELYVEELKREQREMMEKQAKRLEEMKSVQSRGKSIEPVDLIADHHAQLNRHHDDDLDVIPPPEQISIVSTIPDVVSPPASAEAPNVQSTQESLLSATTLTTPPTTAQSPQQQSTPTTEQNSSTKSNPLEQQPVEQKQMPTTRSTPETPPTITQATTQATPPPTEEQKPQVEEKGNKIDLDNMAPELKAILARLTGTDDNGSKH